jgi:alginate O-acetyltransferase complex protein AlgI
MLFNSLTFLYAFLPVVYVVFWRLRTRNQRYAWLTLSSYVFYGFWDYRFCALMALSTATAYVAGRCLLAWKDERRRRLCVIGAVGLDLSMLGFFKYAGFTLASVGQVAAWTGHPLALPILHIILPVGISFYVFHTITYVVDGYRRTITPTKNPLELACYVSLFAQLVAGPIVRFGQIERDLEHLDEARRDVNFDEAWSYFAIGMIKKVLIADTIASIIGAMQPGLSTLTAWLGAIGYCYQLYFDFSGYSDMAVGLGLLFGLRLPQNFDSPYRAVDVSDFWRRWHITLSTVLRDYLYIPMGGSRGPAWKVARNLMVTMLLGGLWHGASWTFVAWGGYHGVLLLVHRRIRGSWEQLPVLVRRAATFFLVTMGWVLFRAKDFPLALDAFHTMFVPTGGARFAEQTGLVAVILVAAAIAHLGPNTRALSHTWKPAQAVGLALLFALCLLSIAGGAPSPFLYFQF